MNFKGALLVSANAGLPVVDVSHSLQLADSLVEFLTVIYGEVLPSATTEEENQRMLDTLRNMPILLVFNKSDSL